MAPGPYQLQGKCRRTLKPPERFGRDERVVLGMDDQAGDGDPTEPWAGAALSIIIVGPRKAVPRCGIGLVEVVNAPDV
jgi:hypothetical protein